MMTFRTSVLTAAACMALAASTAQASPYSVRAMQEKLDRNANGSNQQRSDAQAASDRMIPNANTVFLRESPHLNLGLTPIALLTNGNGNGAGMSSNGLNGPGIDLEQLMSNENCDTAPDERDIVAIGGGDPGESIGAASIGIGSGSAANLSVSFGSLSAGPVPGGPSGGSGGGVVGGGGGGGSSVVVAPGDGDGGNGSPSLGDWNIVPIEENLTADAGTGTSEGSVSPTAVPLPAPVWMALAGLVAIAVFRKRLLP